MPLLETRYCQHVKANHAIAATHSLSRAQLHVPLSALLRKATIMKLTNLLNAQIPRTKNIHPLQRKTGKHLHTPPPEPPHRHQLLHDLVIARTNQHTRAQLAGRKFLGQPMDVLGFALRETGRAEVLERASCDVGRRWKRRGARKERDEFCLYRGGCGAGDLFI